MNFLTFCDEQSNYNYRSRWNRWRYNYRFNGFPGVSVNFDRHQRLHHREKKKSFDWRWTLKSNLREALYCFVPVIVIKCRWKLQIKISEKCNYLLKNRFAGLFFIFDSIYYLLIDMSRFFIKNVALAKNEIVVLSKQHLISFFGGAPYFSIGEYKSWCIYVYFWERTSMYINFLNHFTISIILSYWQIQ